HPLDDLAGRIALLDRNMGLAVFGVAPCQCFTPGGQAMTSPGLISSIGPPQHCVQPSPAVTIRVWPRGWVCQALRAPGSKGPRAPVARAGSGAGNRGSMRTAPVKFSAEPLAEGRDPLRLMSISPLSLISVRFTPPPILASAADPCQAPPA